MLTPEGAIAGESDESRLKRMRMRSWRRGTKEMDLVLGPFADQKLGQMSAAELDLFDRLLSENDQDLMAWILGTLPAPEWISPLLQELGLFAQSRLRR